MDECNSKERDFKFWFPLEMKKAGADGKIRIGGIATDEESPDLQGETVFVKGLDISYLTSRGTFNWDHGKDPADILGEVDIAQKTDGEKKLYVEGFLYPDVKKAQDIQKLMGSMEKADSNRRLGMSLEGKIKERDGYDGKIIKKAWIKNVAVTYHPINQGTYLDFIKSLGDKPIYEPCDCECGTASCPFAKGMCAGYGNPATSGGVSGEALRNESLEKDEKVTTYTEEDLKKKKKANGEITKSDLEERLMEEKGYSPEVANRMSNLLFDVAKSKKTLNKTDVINLLKSKKGYSEEVATRMTDILFSLVKGNVQIPGHTRKYKSGKITQVKPFSQTRSLKAKLAEAKKEGKPTEKIEAEIKKVEGGEAPEKSVGAPESEEAKYKYMKEFKEHLNEGGLKELAKLEEKYGEKKDVLSKEEIDKLVSLGGKPEEMEWITKNPALAKHIIKFAESEKAEKAKGEAKKKEEKPKSEKKPGVAEVEKIHKEGAKADKVHKELKKPEAKEKLGDFTGAVEASQKKEAPKKEAPKISPEAAEKLGGKPVEKEQEKPVSMEMKAEGAKAPEKPKEEAGTKEPEWEVSENKQGTLHAAEFFTSNGKLNVDKYHSIASHQPYDPNVVTPEESGRMIEILKYGLGKYKEVYVEKPNWGSKAADAHWLKINKLIGRQEGIRRNTIKRAEGYPANSKQQRLDLHIALRVQEALPKQILKAEQEA